MTESNEVSRSYIIGIAVDSADELSAISPKVRAFMQELGDGTAEIQVAIGTGDDGDTGAEISTHTIGFAVDSEDDYYEDYDREDD